MIKKSYRCWYYRFVPIVIIGITLVVEQNYGKETTIESCSGVVVQKDEEESSTSTSSCDTEENHANTHLVAEQLIRTDSSRPPVESGVEQNVHAGDGKYMDALTTIVSETTEYLVHTVHVDEQQKYDDTVRQECQNRHELCSYWKLLGECEANPSYMKLQCAPACQTCEYLSYQVRCPQEPNIPNAIEPGDLDDLFQNITTTNTTDFPQQQQQQQQQQYYHPQILSQPSPRKTIFQRLVQSVFHDNNDGPWVVVLDNFLTPEECESFIEWGNRIGYQRSTAVGTETKTNTTPYEDGSSSSSSSSSSSDRIVADYRTSTNTWCDQACEQDGHTQNVIQKIHHLTGGTIPFFPHSEPFQLLKYTEGQLYDRHHDYIHAEQNSPQGPRILTIFLYLNTVEEGGETEFTSLNITVTPQQGRAVVWPNVLNQHPTDIDRRTFHKAHPVVKGTKYGANVWLHLRDNRTPAAHGCA